MENNNQSVPAAGVPPQNWSGQTAPPVERVRAPRRAYSTAERLLLLAALAVAVLFDRLIVATFFAQSQHYPFFAAIFWLSFLVIYYIAYWKRLRNNRVLWMVGGFTALLCIWNFLYDYRSEYGALSAMVIPAVLMAHMQFLAGDYRLKDVMKILQGWLLGWLVKPFSAIPHFSGALGSAFSGRKQSQIKKVAVGAGISLLLILIVVPLLSSADMVFAYYISQVLRNFHIGTFLLHTIIVFLVGVLLYSFLWNIGYEGAAKHEDAANKMEIDALVSCIVLGSMALIYVLFCLVQFTYLFARTGLPGEMTYSEYAREGFSQMIVVCGINLLIFGVFLQYGKRHRVISGLLGALLGLTAVILLSSFVRLSLYINTYGLTWLRLLSGWFILYLAAVLLLCVFRLLRQSVPLIAVSAFLLLGWFVVLGYANPDALVMQHNLRNAPDHSKWLQQNTQYVRRLSDNGVLALLESDAAQRELDEMMDIYRQKDSGYSVSSQLLRDRLGD